MRRFIQLLFAWCWAAMLISCNKDDSLSPVGPTPPPVTTTPVISNLNFSPAKVYIKPDQPTFVINGTLNYSKASGGVASIRLKASTGLDLTVSVPSNNQTEGIVNGSFVFGMLTDPRRIDFEVWIIDMNGTASNKLSGSIELAIDDQGLSWQSFNSSVNLWKVRWIEDLFVAVGENGNVVFLGDGSSWVPIGTEVNSFLRDICWTGNFMVAVGDNSTILTTTFADEWAKPTVPVANAALKGVAWSGIQAVVVGADAEYQRPVILRSNDGDNWSKVNLPELYRGHLNGVIWANNKFMAFGKDGSPVVYTSADGINWSRQNFSGFEGEIMEMVWTGTTYCAVGPGITAISPDGNSWTTKAVSMVPYGVAWSGKYFMMTGFTGMFRSENGLDWTEVRAGGSNPPRSIAWSGLRYVAVGGPHGATWMVSP
ncbi:MAG TPA: hypothetical protein VK166_09330 [Chitinophagaceae bacterium]|nr:hypothetical protein [Chitinophagaceae bacterium]